MTANYQHTYYNIFHRLTTHMHRLSLSQMLLALSPVRLILPRLPSTQLLPECIQVLHVFTGHGANASLATIRSRHPKRSITITFQQTHTCYSRCGGRPCRHPEIPKSIQDCVCVRRCSSDLLWEKRYEWLQELRHFVGGRRA